MSYGSFLLRLACGVLPAIAAWGQQYTINTIAGNQALGAGYGADNDAATADQLNGPLGLALDSKGNLYIADSLNHRVRKVSNGIITTIAGNGTGGFSGDTGAATSAELLFPSGVAVDSAGNVYIADTGNNVIRKVTTDGKINTYAGNEGLGPGYGGDNGTPTNAGAQFFSPVGLALDPSGNLYIADSGNHLIRKIKADGSLLTTVVGSDRVNDPVGIGIDPSGQNMYIADIGNKNIARFRFADGSVVNFAGDGASGYAGDGGPANSVATMINDAAAVAADAAGNVYIADTVNSLVRVVTPNGIITTIAGRTLSGGRPFPGYSGDGGSAISAQLYSPKGIVLDTTGHIYIADTGNSVVRTLTPTYPTISTGGIGNAFSYKTQISPGAAAVIYGTGLSAASPVTLKTPLNTTANGVSVTVNGLAAPLYYVSAGQIDFQVPWETGLGTATVVVTANGLPSNSASVPVVAAGPGLYPIVENYPDYSLNTAANPVAAGGTIIAYATGSGPVDTNQTDGAAVPNGATVKVTSTCTAAFGTTGANVSFCGLATNSVGLVQVNIDVPSGLAAGSYPLTVTIDGQASNAATVNVK